MTLNTLSSKWLETTGNVVGFSFKSSVSGKVFKAITKTAGGKFLSVGTEGGNEVLLDGTVDRYVMFGGSSRLSEINAEISNLEEQRDALEARICELDEEADALSSAG